MHECISNMSYQGLRLQPCNGNGGNGAGDSDAKILCICSGLDFVNLTYTYFLAKNSNIAESWCQNLRAITHNYKANNVCAMMQLQKQ